MVLTFICSLGVATAGDIKVQAILLGALGCNLACWAAVCYRSSILRKAG
jgi:hypothetical protein